MKMGKKDINPGIIAMFCGFAGVILAFIEKALYDGGTGVNALANIELTITELMVLTIIIWIIIGIIIGVAKS